MKKRMSIDWESLAASERIPESLAQGEAALHHSGDDLFRRLLFCVAGAGRLRAAVHGKARVRAR